MEMTPIIISRIEKNQRHVCDAELRMIAKALNVSMDWLCGDDDNISLK
jgi:transcriptional regulator with XRE-family HTH domain